MRRLSRWCPVALLLLACGETSSGDGDAAPAPADAAIADVGPAADAAAMPDAAPDAAATPDASIAADAFIPPSDGGVPTTFGASSCGGETTTISASEGEDGHWLGIRLTPPSWPFVVDELRFFLAGSVQSGCSTGLPVRILAVVADGETPPVAPVEPLVGDMPPDPEAPEFRGVQVGLPEPLVIPPGQTLWLLVRMTRDADGKVCLAMCEDAARLGEGWWSFATAPPFAWRPLGDLGIGARPVVEVNGRAFGE
jgi:hypothetical protein